MRVRFGILIAVSAAALVFFALGQVASFSVIGVFSACVLFLIGRPLPGRKLLFKSEPLDEREVAHLHRTDSIAITAFFMGFILWWLIIFAWSLIDRDRSFVSPFRWFTVAMQTIPGFALIHSVTGFVVFSRK